MCQNPVAKEEVRLLEMRRWWDSGREDNQETVLNVDFSLTW